MDVRQYGPQIFPPYGTDRVKIFPPLTDLERDEPRASDADPSEDTAPAPGDEGRSD